MNPVVDTFRAAVSSHRARTALVCKERRISYAELGERVEAAARALPSALSTSPGEARRLGIYLDNSIDYVVCYYAAIVAGYVPYLLDSKFQAREIESIRDDCGISRIVVARGTETGFPLPCTPGGAPTDDTVALALEGLHGAFAVGESGVPPFPPSENAVTCRFSSGTTGKPKCIEFTGSAVVAAATNWAKGTDLRDSDRILCLAALSNGLAFNTSLLAAFIAGAQLHFFRGLPVARGVAGYIAREEITRLVAFPTVYRVLVSDEDLAPALLESLTTLLSAGAPLWPDVRKRFAERFGRNIADYYGIAETGPVTFEPCTTASEGLGRPLPGADLRIAREDPNATSGEVLVRTESMATRYVNFPGVLEAKIDAEGYYHSGDIGEVRDGRLYLTGRVSSFVNVGGRNVDPEEVSQVALLVPGVDDAVAFQDEGMNGESILHLVVATRTGLSRADVIKGCRQQIADWKLPARITFLNTIPRNGAGKPVLSQVRSLANDRRDARTEMEMT